MMYGIRINCINTIQFKLNRCMFSMLKSSHDNQHVCDRNTTTTIATIEHNTSSHSLPFNTTPNRRFSVSNPVLNKYHKWSRNIRQLIRIIRVKDLGIEHNYKQDKMDKDVDTLIYRGEFNRSTAFWALLFGSIVNIACVIIWINLNIFERDSVENCDTTRKFSYRYGILIVMAYTVITVIVARRYVLRIYYNQFENVFKLSIYRWYFPFTTTTFNCNYGEPVHAKASNYFMGNCKIKNRRYTIAEDSFIYGLYYNLFYGYDTPQSFERFIEQKL